MAVLTKEEVYSKICRASYLSALGLFVGAGFSKDVLSDSHSFKTYTWKELLEKSCSKFKINFDSVSKDSSNPEIASKICRELAQKGGKTREEAEREFKKEICELVAAYPERPARKAYAEAFRNLDISWVVTTNYDCLLESIFEGRALSIPPTGHFINPKDIVPIYHIHGVCHSPEDIVITNEDYVKLFRPSDYRQNRLPFLMKESLILMIGYSLSDINVITALDWANNVYTNTSVEAEYDYPIIQVLYSKTPQADPYFDENGIIIIETDNLRALFAELSEFNTKYKDELGTYSKKLYGWMDYLNGCDEKQMEKFLQDEDGVQSNLIKILSELPCEFGFFYSAVFPFIGKALKKVDKMAAVAGAFEAYNQKINFILNVLIYIPFKKIPPAVFSLICFSLGQLKPHITLDGSKVKGLAHAASETWANNKNKIPAEVIEEMKVLANSNSTVLQNLQDIIADIEK